MKTEQTEIVEAMKVAQESRVKYFITLGNIMLKEAGEAACQSGYGTVDPEWVGRYALAYGDINRDGTLN